MLPKTRRVSRNLFKSFNAKGNVFYGNFFNLNLIPLSDNKVLSKKSLFAVPVSKKIEASAVIRNKIRRRTYSVIEKNLKNIKEGYVFIFYPKKTIKNQNFSDYLSDIELLLKKSKTLTE